MRVSLIKERKIQNLVLPEKVEGTYWITDTDSNGIKRNLISLEAQDGKWHSTSNNDVFYTSNDVMIPDVTLELYHFYNLKNKLERIKYLLYCSPVEMKYNRYDVNMNLDKGIPIGSDKKAIINYKFLEANAALIKREEDKVYVYDKKSKFGVYVNNVRINERQELRTGDVIFIIGMKIIYTVLTSENGEPSVYLCVNNAENGAIVVNLLPIGIDILPDEKFVESEEESEFPLYDENEYFHKKPRFVSMIHPLELKVDAPPSKQDEEKSPLLLTLGPMVSMSMISLVTVATTLNNVTNGTTTWDKAMPSLVIAGAMFASMFVWPLLTKWYERRSRKRKEKKRQKKYGAYIQEKRQAIVDAKKEQASILENNFPSSKICEEVILNHYTSLWQRRIEDGDYLLVSLGKGDCPMKIDIQYPEEHFTLVEDNLKNLLSQLGNEPKVLSNVPISFSLIENYVTAIVGSEQVTGETVRRILLQLLTFQSYDDLKIVTLTDEENEYQWKFLKDVPHSFNDLHTLRYFATNSDEYKEVCYHLDTIFKERQEKFNNNDPVIEEMDKIYVIITDSLKKVRNFDIIKHILNSKKNYGFCLVVIDHKITNLPDQCKSIIQLKDEVGELHNNVTYDEPIKFKLEIEGVIDYESCARVLSNIPIEIDSDDEGQLPNKLGFLEMYDVGKVEQLNSLSRWKTNNPILNLQVPVGVGKNGETISIDLHEKYHGPHGLIAGMTGSGKSEFIITYILSMAVNYHPYEVQFILIDYKGGGLAGAFENKNTGLKLPHLVGTITNLDANEIKRSLASIESELKRRQSLFNKARELSGESTIDIYKYQQMFREGLVKEPISHLFIISDEFAELKDQEPEFMDQLISTARIGRSLGVHLILATQKPSGVVDPQIWSNSRFRICMRVQEKADSNEVIKTPDAAYLKQTGRFYFQVGYNEVFLLGQAAWAGGKYYPSDKVKRTLDTSINFIDNIGFVYRTVETKEKKVMVKSQGEELGNLVKYLSSLAEEQNVRCRPLWLEKIPAFITVENLKEKYRFQKENFVLNPVVGEYDVPKNQEQRVLTLPLTSEGNAVIFGASGSGKENFIITLIYSSLLTYVPQEVNYYLIDFGSGALKVFAKCPLVGDVLTADDEDKISNLFKMLSTTIDERKKLFADFNGDYVTYCRLSGKSVPNIVVIINNYESYQETYSQFDDMLVVLSREASKYGIYFVLTCNTPNGIRFKLRQNFALICALQQNSDDDYTTILGNVYKTYPAKIFGRGIIKTDDVYEFQTALATTRENIPSFIKERCEAYSRAYTVKAKPVPVLPGTVSYDDISSQVGRGNDLVIGLTKKDLNVCKYNFVKNYMTIISSLDISITSNFINPLIKQILFVNKSNLYVINAEDYVIESKNDQSYEYADSRFDDVFQSLYDFVKAQREIYLQGESDKKVFQGRPPLQCIIIGLGSFIEKLSSENKTKVAELFNNGKDLEIIDYIIVDSVDKIKSLEYESWFKNCINTNNGIWIGNGINEQFMLKITQRITDMKEEAPDNFCFVIKRGKPVYVKYVEKFDIPVDDTVDVL